MRTFSFLNGLACAALLACHGCADDFDPASRVEGLRVLAVQADKPVAQPGDEVTLRALYHDPEARTLSWAFGFCESPDSSSALACAQRFTFANLQFGTAPEYTFRVPSGEDAENLLAGDALGMLVVACPGALVEGNTQGIPLRCLDASGRALELSEFELGIKRVFVDLERRQTNPEIEVLLWNGQRWPEGEVREVRCEDAGKKCKRNAIELRAREKDTELRPNVHRIVQFYATGGTFEDDVRTLEDPDTTWRPRPEDKGKRISMWFVLRDDQGGVTWTERHVQVH